MNPPVVTALQARAEHVNEWLREGGNADIADLIRDLLAHLDALTAELETAKGDGIAIGRLSGDVLAAELQTKLEAADASRRALEEQVAARLTALEAQVRDLSQHIHACRRQADLQ